MDENMGGSSKFTPKRRRIILDSIREGRTKEASCRVAGIAVNTLNRWLAVGESEHGGPTHRKFWVDWGQAIQASQDKLLEQVQDGDVTVGTETIIHPDGTQTTRKHRVVRKTSRGAMEMLRVRFPAEYGGKTQDDVEKEESQEEVYVDPLENLLKPRENKESDEKKGDGNEG